jgi:hypothetical protein
MHRADPDAAAGVVQVGAERVVEALDGVLGGAVGGLQRDPAVGQRRADLDDGAAVAGPHAGQRGQGAVHVAEVDPSATRRYSSAVISQVGANTEVMALLTHTSGGPSSASSLAAAASTWAASATSAATQLTWGAPSRSASARAACRPARPRASSPSRAPRRANSRVTARPTPALAPVITVAGVVLVMCAPFRWKRRGSGRGGQPRQGLLQAAGPLRAVVGAAGRLDLGAGHQEQIGAVPLGGQGLLLDPADQTDVTVDAGSYRVSRLMVPRPASTGGPRSGSRAPAGW